MIKGKEMGQVESQHAQCSPLNRNRIYICKENESRNSLGYRDSGIGFGDLRIVDCRMKKLLLARVP